MSNAASRDAPPGSYVANHAAGTLARHASAGVADAFVERVVFGGHAEQFFDLVRRIEPEHFLLADPRLRIGLRIGQRHRQLQRVAIDTPVPLLEARLLADRVAEVIEPGALVEAGRLHDELIAVPAAD